MAPGLRVKAWWGEDGPDDDIMERDSFSFHSVQGPNPQESVTHPQSGQISVSYSSLESSPDIFRLCLTKVLSISQYNQIDNQN